MAEPTNHPRPTLPALSLPALRRALAGEAGADAAARALQAAGMAAGDALHAELARQQGGLEALRALPFSAFVEQLSARLEEDAWGTLAADRLHTGVGVLESADWAEAEAGSAEARPSCFFTTGMLANLLGAAAGAELAVLEVECRSRGDARCRFAFGGEAALVGLHGSLAGGLDLESSVGRLA